MKVTLTSGEGVEYDVTEHFRLLYDTAVQSMDWGSGFLDDAEMLRILQAGTLLDPSKIGAEVASILKLGDFFESHIEAAPAVPHSPWSMPIPFGDPKWVAHRDQLESWRARRKAWVHAFSNKLLGELPTFEAIGKLLEDREKVMNDVTGFDEAPNA